MSSLPAPNAIVTFSTTPSATVFEKRLQRDFPATLQAKSRRIHYEIPGCRFTVVVKSKERERIITLYTAEGPVHSNHASCGRDPDCLALCEKKVNSIPFKQREANHEIQEGVLPQALHKRLQAFFSELKDLSWNTGPGLTALELTAMNKAVAIEIDGKLHPIDSCHYESFSFPLPKN